MTGASPAGRCQRKRAFATMVKARTVTFMQIASGKYGRMTEITFLPGLTDYPSPLSRHSIFDFAVCDLRTQSHITPHIFTDAERWLSGLRRRFRKPLWAFAHPGFESLSLRHFSTKKVLKYHMKSHFGTFA